MTTGNEYGHDYDGRDETSPTDVQLQVMGVTTPGLGWLPQPPDARDKQLAAEHPELMASTLKSLRRKVDMAGWVGYVNQMQTNSCVGHGIWVAFMHALKRAGLQPHDASPFFIYWCARVVMGGNWTQMDQGAYIRDGFKGLNQFGVASRALYESYKPLLSPSQQAFLEALEHQAIKYTAIPMDIMQWKTVLDSDIPIVYGFNVYQNHTDVYNTGNWPQPGGIRTGGHCECAIGYDDDRGRIEQMKSQGSWGSIFGPEGWFNWKTWDYVMREGSDAWMLEVVEGVPVTPPTPPAPTPTPPSPSFDITQVSDAAFDAEFNRRRGFFRDMDIEADMSFGFTNPNSPRWQGKFRGKLQAP